MGNIKITSRDILSFIIYEMCNFDLEDLQTFVECLAVSNSEDDEVDFN